MKNSIRRDLTGKWFGEIEVLDRAGTQGKNILWKCKCHACGKIVVVLAPTLRNTRKSCGCKRGLKGKDSPLFKGTGEISMGFYKRIKRNANRRDIKFNVTIQELWKLFLKQNKKCALTGKILTMPGDPKTISKDAWTASLDRIDSSKGYIKGNVQWVHKHVNLMKQWFDEKYFIKLCENVIEYKKETK